VLSAIHISAVVLAMSVGLPAGWRRPVPAEVKQEWRSKDEGRFLIADGDFDGDKKKDHAEILVEAGGKQFGVVVWLSSARRAMILEKGDIGSLERMGIAIVQPGSYRTACGKGYGDWACANGEPENLALKNQAIDFFAHESADAILYWDLQKKEFNRIQMSD
jgi:hypothetical protein